MQKKTIIQVTTLTLATLVVLGVGLVGSQSLAARPSQQGGAPLAQAVYRGVAKVERFDVSPELRSIAPLQPNQSQRREDERDGAAWTLPDQRFTGDTQHAQTALGPLAMPTPIVSFNGVGSTGANPPDTNGDVGPNHYVIMTNLSFQVFSKTGTSVYGPAANNTLWAGFGGPCQTENAGDPVVVYDQLADRWLLMQFTAGGAPYYICLALSQTPDPAGSYYRFAINTGSNFPDYPKMSMWPDAYYVSTREFPDAGGFAGVGAYALNRAQFLAGNPDPLTISFLATPTPAYNVGDGLLPGDLDGWNLPPAGSPNYWVGSMDDGGGYGAPTDALTLWEYTVDWVNPPNSSFNLVSTLNMTAPIDTVFPCTPSARSCIPQPGTANRADILSYRQRPMHRLAYRNFGDHESLVTNQSVEGSTGMAGMRWWELRGLSGTASIYQEGTYVPGSTDNIHRWMGSMAMDSVGNMALGYSVSDATNTYPGVRYTGRLAADPLGTLPQGEGTLVNGAGSMTGGGNRWGDYSAMTVDPVDDCTFWYTTEYYATTSTNGWSTRIGSFKFPNCVVATPTATATGTVPTPTDTPVPATRTLVPTASNTPTASSTPLPVCNYTVATATATVEPGGITIGNSCDDCMTTINFPFPLQFYTQWYTSGNVSSNGNLQFVGNDSNWVNACLPTGSINQAIIPHWDDLLTTGAGNGVFSNTLGTAPNRIFTLEWRTTYVSNSAPANFEIVFHENSGDYEFVYGTIGNGSSATEGVQRFTGPQYTQFACNTSATSAGLEVMFSGCSAATSTPTATAAVTDTPTPAPTDTPTVTATSVPMYMVYMPFEGYNTP